MGSNFRRVTGGLPNGANVRWRTPSSPSREPFTSRAQDLTAGHTDFVVDLRGEILPARSVVHAAGYCLACSGMTVSADKVYEGARGPRLAPDDPGSRRRRLVTDKGLVEPL
jgi:hypothetical protein